MKSVLIFLFCAAFAWNAHAQQHQKYGLQVIERMCAPDMHGRGYVNGGDSIAAAYIASEFQKAGIQPLGKSYYQHFSFGVNIFPGKMDLSLDGIALKAGEDYLVESNSGGGEGTRDVWVLTPKMMETEGWASNIKDADFLKTHIVVLDASALEDKTEQNEFFQLKYSLAKLLPVVVVRPDHPIWSVGRTAFPYPIFEVEAEHFKAGTETVSYNVEQKFVDAHKTQNVIGYIKGKHKKRKKQFVFFTGHYDHLGRMGAEAYFPGANDNASGIAMILSLARHYAENPPDYTIVFIAFAGEEAGLLGSEYFTDHPMVKMKKIRFVINLDILGTGDDGITVVNGTVYKKEFELMQKINDENDYLARVKIRGETQNSDHYHFHKNGVPAVFIYTMGGIAHYHNVFDKSETLPLTEFEDLHHLLRDFVDRL